MKKIIILLLIFICKYSLAQQSSNNLPTQFDKFIERSDIDWAAYRSGTIRFSKINLNELLRTKFQKGLIKGSTSLESRSFQSNKIAYADKIMIDNMFTFDLSRSKIKKNALEVSQPFYNRFDSSVNSVINLTEILYIDKGKLRSYIAWVSPQVAIYANPDLFVGICNYFSTAFNFDYNFAPAKTDTIIYLGKTHRQFFTDSFTSNDRLKELYGRTLIETLWPYVLNGKLKIFSLKTNKKLSPKELDINLTYETPLIIPIFDSVGNEIGNKPIIVGSILEFIGKIEMAQEWYYDVSKNIVYDKIPEIILFSHEAWLGNSDLAPILKILF